jgi:hypothetical protein
VLQCAGVVSRVFDAPSISSAFGFLPKISTPVENTVENRVKWSSCGQKANVFDALCVANVAEARFFNPLR